MSSNNNKAVVRHYYEEVVSTGSVERLRDFLSPEYTEVHEGKRYPLGIEGARDHIQGVRQTYGDLKIKVDRQIAEGEWVVSCITARGIHIGWWMGIRPTGKAVTFTGVNVDRVIDGKIVEHGGAANILGPLLEAGAIRVVGES
ncbi:MAG TPA: ester cyclase [Thermoanaerobaculia bacterium]|nr:ester cyclase [Thermoanaerobaculia bacterium]HUM29220.1 ester cyclase [Thermoanaerobaculia bacterium]HXK67821.1 ester cyclase [Thermoanaerobaculia bacterium]